jgi:hypothetical protein
MRSTYSTNGEVHVQYLLFISSLLTPVMVVLLLIPNNFIIIYVLMPLLKFDSANWRLVFVAN